MKGTSQKVPFSLLAKKYIGRYTLTLIPCRKVNRLHAGSIPSLPTKNGLLTQMVEYRSEAPAAQVRSLESPPKCSLTYWILKNALEALK